jgi:hypothetical protein
VSLSSRHARLAQVSAKGGTKACMVQSAWYNTYLVLPYLVLSTANMYLHTEYSQSFFAILNTTVSLVRWCGRFLILWTELTPMPSGICLHSNALSPNMPKQHPTCPIFTVIKQTGNVYLQSSKHHAHIHDIHMPAAPCWTSCIFCLGDMGNY